MLISTEICMKMLECMFNCSLMECAKEMIKESLPIKCLEAVVLAMYPCIHVDIEQIISACTALLIAFTNMQSC